MATVETRTEAQKAAIAKARAAKSQARREAEAVAREPGDGDAQEMGRMLEADEKVRFTIPVDPSRQDGDQMWERSFNGLFLVFQRGVEYEQPKHIVDFIEERERVLRLSDARTAAFRSASGKKLEL